MLPHPVSMPLILPADVYDTLELAAEANGGVGHGLMYEDQEREIPLDVHGLLEWARGENAWVYQQDLLALGLDPLSLSAVFWAHDVPFGARVPFAQWVRWMGIEREAGLDS